MLPSKYIAFIVFVFIVGTLVGTVLEYDWVSNQDAKDLESITTWQTITEDQDWGVFSIVGNIPDYFDGLYHTMTWDFAFIQGTEWEMYRWIVVMPFLATFVYGLIMTVIGVFTRSLS